jgi:hypothetical protein
MDVDIGNILSEPALPAPDVPGIHAPPIPNASSEVHLTHTGRPMRTYRKLRRLYDWPPEGPAPVLPAPPPTPNIIKWVVLYVRDSFRTAVNQFGILREYPHRPSYDPDAFVTPEDLANFPVEPSMPSTSSDSGCRFTPPWPFENMSKYLLMNWYHTGSSQKTEQELSRLVKDVIGAPEFKAEDLTGFSARRENKRLDDAQITEGSGDGLLFGDDWHEVVVDIEVPVPTKGATARRFSIPGFHHRSILEVIKTTWRSAAFSQLHLAPFRRIHVHPDTGVETRIFDEVYTSEAFEDAHNELQKQPLEPGCKLERVVAGLMFWSDSTNLTHFGHAKVWPLYMYFANQSKYARAKPSSGACHHLAYIPSVRNPSVFKWHKM